MPIITLQLSPSGPLIDFLLGVSGPRETALRAAQAPIPSPLPVRGLIDTGASCTCVDATLLEALRLTPRGTVPIHTPSTAGIAHTANQFDVSLRFQFAGSHFAYSALSVVEAHLSAQGIQALIGRDVLSNALFTYNGPAGIFLLAL